ncbi:double homeobox protein 4-like protein 4-like [Planoprotostelium fungivorum]|uniref:Double homeobox protein 4-like protein 4-like n=1 Tax=Planoprotostelium fungivorum TaxID=1890364 RepID=A0A2P6N5W5_9EUKA|nr:double homeobox protein 4-like protein 4-like [Planoprotostelium fungivorum]
MEYDRNPYPSLDKRRKLAETFRTTEKRVNVWFQNKRSRSEGKDQPWSTEKEGEGNGRRATPAPE